jgi:hypothetical protein
VSEGVWKEIRIFDWTDGRVRYLEGEIEIGRSKPKIGRAKPKIGRANLLVSRIMMFAIIDRFSGVVA